MITAPPRKICRYVCRYYRYCRYLDTRYNSVTIQLFAAQPPSQFIEAPVLNISDTTAQQPNI